MLLFKLNFVAMMLLQTEVSFDLRSMWASMGFAARAVVVILAIMSAWSIGVMIDRYIAFSQARKQSREFAPAVAGCLREGKIEEAISVAEQNKRSHLAKVVEAGLQEFRAHTVSREIAGEQIESSRRACERAEAIVNAELKRGLSGLATIGATAPFVGLFGTTVGIINAFQGMSSEKNCRSVGCRGRYFGSSRHHSIRFVRGGAGSMGI
jgi:biopolymer transport protein ExbB/biopolymer transport protein TolQ